MMNEMLRNRISALVGGAVPMNFQEGGEVDQMAEMAMTAPVAEMIEPSAMMMAEAPPEPMADSSTEDLEQAISLLMRERDMTVDPDERDLLEGMTENLAVASQAPLAEQAMMLAQQGRGGDTRLAHLRVGEVVLPPEAFDDADFEFTVGQKFEELDLDPEAYVVGAGIASLNPITGLEEFGFFKKAFKSLKKVATAVAPVAIAVPGVGTALGAALGGVGGLAGSALGSIPGLGGVVSTAGGLASSALKGIGSLGIPGISPIAGGASAGSFTAPFRGMTGANALRRILGGGPLGAAGSTYYGGPTAGKGLANVLGIGSGASPAQQVAQLSTTPEGAKLVAEARAAGAKTPEEILQQLGVSTGIGSQLSGLLGGRAGGLGGLLGGRSGGLGGGFGGLGNLAGLGAAGLLGKLALDEAKDRRGVPLTPLTQEGATGRYNIEAEIARRTGQAPPNPVEFGLLPTGTLPTLSGGRESPRRRGRPVMSAPFRPSVMSAAYGGPVMAFAEGGNVDFEDFKRMDGKINGPGTETSDDIPAMLSDGEFVMTGRAVRGAGAFDMKKSDQGIITLTPSGSESRDKGTSLMYQMMDSFAEYADKPEGAAA